MTTTAINYPKTASRGEWLEARRKLLVKEMALTRDRDQLNTDRRRLPMVEIDKPYVFEGAAGKNTLLDLLEGRLQLIVYHFMWRWENAQPLDAGCPSCSTWTDEISRGHLNALRTRDTSFCLVSRAPLEKIAPFK